MGTCRRYGVLALTGGRKCLCLTPYGSARPACGTHKTFWFTIRTSTKGGAAKTAEVLYPSVWVRKPGRQDTTLCDEPQVRVRRLIVDCIMVVEAVGFVTSLGSRGGDFSSA